MEITKIVITGGPCAGKTTAMSWIQHHFTRMGYTVLFIPETATELITGGVAPWTCGSNLDYQKCQIQLQLKKEEIFRQAAESMKDEKILIVCDRGIMDNKAYMNETEFHAVANGLHLDRSLCGMSTTAYFIWSRLPKARKNITRLPTIRHGRKRRSRHVNWTIS